MTQMIEQDLEAAGLTAFGERTGSTRSAIPGAVRARRRARALTPAALLAAAAIAFGGAAIPAVAGGAPAAVAQAPSVAELEQDGAQTFHQADLAAGVAAESQPAADETPFGAEGRDGVTVEVATPTPTPTPTPTATAKPSASASASEDDSSNSASSGSSDSSDSSGGGYIAPAGEAQQIAHDMVMARGWGEGQFACLVKLWNRESGWRVTAENPSSGAYGIPQALPGSKMASVGGDWRTNAATQITWGLGYIAGRYGTPCGAWDHSESVGWY